MSTFINGYRCTRSCETEVQLCRFAWFNHRIADGSLNGTIYNQCHSVSAGCKTRQSVTTVLIRFDSGQRRAAVLRFNSNIRALDGMSCCILNDTFEGGVCGRCACDEKHDPNEVNSDRFDKHNKSKTSMWR